MASTAQSTANNNLILIILSLNMTSRMQGELTGVLLTIATPHRAPPGPNAFTTTMTPKGQILKPASDIFAYAFPFPVTKVMDACYSRLSARRLSSWGGCLRSCLLRASG